MPDRQAFTAIVYVLRTGIQWNALPCELGASSTVHDHFQEWEEAGVFKALWQAGLCAYDEMQGIQWEWQAVDGVMTKAPFGQGAAGPNPTDRAKTGTKRSMLTDGAGFPWRWWSMEPTATIVSCFVPPWTASSSLVLSRAASSHSTCAWTLDMIIQ